MTSAGARRALRESLVTFAALTVAVILIAQLRWVPGAAEYVHLSVAALFLVVALRMAQRAPAGVAGSGMALGGLLLPPEQAPAPGVLGALRELATTLRSAVPSALAQTGVALATALVVFPPFAVGFYLWHQPEQSFSWQPPAELGSYLLSQLLVIALPEEALFRGYLQTRLGDHFDARVRWLGAELSPAAWVLQAVLFALMHAAVDLRPARLAVFFPGLLFGWLRARQGGIGAPIVLHAVSNLYSDLLVRGWLLD